MANLLKVLLYLFSVIQLVLLSDGEKRLILHSGDDIAREFQILRQEMAEMKANHSKEMQILKDNQTQEIQNLKASHQQEITWLGADILVLKKDQGSTYVRWGRTTCNGNGTEKIYSGFTAGTPYDQKGAGSNLCLPQHPSWAKYKDGIQNIGGLVSGTEYDIYEDIFEPFSQRMHDQDIPCVVCRSKRPTTVMIPGKKDCFSDWTTEYVGFLMSGHSVHTGNADYACVDVDPEAVYHGEANQNGKLFNFNEVKCGSLPCQEYPNGRELACAVCSK